VTKKKNMLKKIERSEDLQSHEKEFLKDNYLKYVKRNGAQKPATQANYLQAIRKITERIGQDITELNQIQEEDLYRLNEEIIDKIQDSQFRETKGETSHRRKRHLWASWKKLLQTHKIQTEERHPHIPKVELTTDKNKVERQADTKPEDLPTPEQMKNYIKELGQISGESTQLRNQAMMLLMWDKGPRIGELLQIKIEDIHVRNDKVKIRIPGNKGSKNRPVEVFQGRKTLIDYIEQHPAHNDPDAYLFCQLKHRNFYEELGKATLRQKVHQARSTGNFNFKTHGEPFHIFRKAMVTSHRVNEWASWEEICTWHGKKTDSTKPDYLKMALNDVNSSVAERMGVESMSSEEEKENRMKGEPLLPSKCTSCDKMNRCYHETCQSCSAELPDSQMPKDQDLQEDESIVVEDRIDNLKQNLQELEEEVETEK
jgi:site-specific recombinase XerD